MMTVEERREAQDSVAAFLEPEEQIELIDSFRMKTNQEIVRSALILGVCAIAFVAVMIWLGPKLGLGLATQRIIGLITFCGVIPCLAYPCLSVMGNINWIIAVTDLRIIIMSPPTGESKAGAFFWSLAPTDVASMEKRTVDGSSNFTLRMHLTSNRSTMAHMRLVEFHGLEDANQIANKLESRQIRYHHHGLMK